MREEGRRVLLLVVTRELVTFWAGRRRIWGMTLVYVFFFERSPIYPLGICLSVQFATLNFNLVQVSTSNSNNRSEYNPFTVFTARPMGFFFMYAKSTSETKYTSTLLEEKKRSCVPHKNETASHQGVVDLLPRMFPCSQSTKA
jgi:hypothetical protein